ncbi:substrate-binding periplasmic protein [Dongshaea marina]|uniref:substrate-binding periplasmic protein n=1 Tax=Dongshaea marina TaxID=2047966 RepID=UPI000D3E2260|nr:transporter substrate-binding domain-containing protein [Dongshaea marina]
MRASFLRTALFGLLLGFSQQIYATQVVTVTDAEWPPLNSVHLKGDGIAPQIVRAAFAHSGITAKFHHLKTWKEAFETAKQGQYDSSIGYVYNEERAKYFLYSDPVFTSNVYWFYLKDNPKAPFEWDKLQQHQGLVIGATRGYWYGPEYGKMLKDERINIVLEDSDNINFQKLLDGKIDLFPINQCVGFFLLKSRFKQAVHQISNSPHPLSVKEHFLIVSKRIPNAEQVVAKFNEGLKQYKAEKSSKLRIRCYESIR